MKKQISILVAEDALSDIHGMGARLTGAGLEQTKVLKDAGVITGLIDESSIETLRGYAGVSGIEEAKEFQLPHPDSDVQ